MKPRKVLDEPFLSLWSFIFRFLLTYVAQVTLEHQKLLMVKPRTALRRFLEKLPLLGLL